MKVKYNNIARPIYAAIIATLKSQSGLDEVHVTASTGLAAVNIGGITLHK